MVRRLLSRHPPSSVVAALQKEKGTVTGVDSLDAVYALLTNTLGVGVGEAQQRLSQRLLHQLLHRIQHCEPSASPSTSLPHCTHRLDCSR